MLALTDIFKNIVHSEIENKQLQSTAKTAATTASQESVVVLLER